MTSVDWPSILSDLAHLLGEPYPGGGAGRTPLGTRALAVKLGCHRETIRRWQDGAEPGHTDGEQLLERWSAMTGKAHAFAPRVKRPVSVSKL
jgi:hypothetical protein